MAHETQSESYVFSGRAASAIQPYGVVSFPIGSGIDYGLVPAAAGSGPCFGVSRASHAVGDAAEAIVFGEAKVRALASLGAGCRVVPAVAGSIGVMPLVLPSAPLQSGNSVGIAVQNATLNDIFTILVSPLSTGS